jgi:hypothetical protein
MIQKMARGLIILAGIALLVDSAVGRQPMTTADKITVRLKDGATKNYEGNLVFAATGLQIQGPDKKMIALVNPNDIVKIVPGDLPGIERGDMFKLIGLEDKKTKADYTAAKLGYEDMKKKAAAAPAGTKRYIDYKIALMNSRIADETGYDEGWRQVGLEAAKGWGDFIANYPTGYEIWPASLASARAYAELGKFEEAARVWNRLTKKESNLPANLVLEAKINEIDAQVRTKTGAATAVGSASALIGSAPAGPMKDKLTIYEAAAKVLNGGDLATGVKTIEGVIAATKDSATRGVAYSMLGEIYRDAGRPRDAMWAFLWVETVYNADKDEAFRAMCRLADVFKTQMDDDKVRAYQEKLRRARGNF